MLLYKNRKNKQRTGRLDGGRMQEKIKIRPGQRCFLIRSSPDIQLLKRSPLRRRRASLLPHHMISARQSDIIYSPVDLQYLCPPAHLLSCTVHLYTHLSTSPVFLVFASVRKYYINIYNR